MASEKDKLTLLCIILLQMLMSIKLKLKTVYKLGLPNLEDETVTTAFQWLRDVCDGILFLEEEIEIERGVVMSELQDKDSVGERIWEQTLDWLIPDHLRSERDTIGTEETISSLTRQQFMDYYDTYYVPRRVIFSIVGDMEVSAMEELIQQYFASKDLHRKS